MTDTDPACRRCQCRKPDVKVSSPFPFPLCNECWLRTPSGWEPREKK